MSCRVCSAPTTTGIGQILRLCVEHAQDYDYFCAQMFGSDPIADTRVLQMYVETKRKDLFG